MHFAIERHKRDELLVRQPHTVGYSPNKLLLNTDSGDLFHLFVYKKPHATTIYMSLVYRWPPDGASYLVNFPITIERIGSVISYELFGYGNSKQ